MAPDRRPCPGTGPWPGGATLGPGGCFPDLGDQRRNPQCVALASKPHALCRSAGGSAKGVLHRFGGGSSAADHDGCVEISATATADASQPGLDDPDGAAYDCRLSNLLTGGLERTQTGHGRSVSPGRESGGDPKGECHHIRGRPGNAGGDAESPRLRRIRPIFIGRNWSRLGADPTCSCSGGSQAIRLPCPRGLRFDRNRRRASRHTPV